MFSYPRVKWVKRIYQRLYSRNELWTESSDKQSRITAVNAVKRSSETSEELYQPEKITLTVSKGLKEESVNDSQLHKSLNGSSSGFTFTCKLGNFSNRTSLKISFSKWSCCKTRRCLIIRFFSVQATVSMKHWCSSSLLSLDTWNVFTPPSTLRLSLDVPLLQTDCSLNTTPPPSTVCLYQTKYTVVLAILYKL